MQLDNGVNGVRLSPAYLISQGEVSLVSTEAYRVDFPNARRGRLIDHRVEMVPQVYLGPPKHRPSNAQFAIRALCDFGRVHLSA
jgi:hypothetical protein